mgnify:CR=1 FL=1
MKYLIIILAFLTTSTVVQAQNNSPEQKLEDLGITLPTMTTPSANFVHVVRSGNLLFLSGKGSKNADGSLQEKWVKI